MPGQLHEDSPGSGLFSNETGAPAHFSTDIKHPVLLGPFGLRAGWSILLFFLLYFLLSWALSFALRRTLSAGQHAVRASVAAPRTPVRHPAVEELAISDALSSEFVQASAVLLATWIMARLERRRFRVYGLHGPGPRAGLADALGGTLVGLAALGLLAGTLRGLHLLVFDARLLELPAALGYGAEWFVVFAAVGVFEEFFFRGYSQFTLTRGLLGVGERLSPAHPQRAAFWIAAVCWSVLFLLVHVANQGETAPGLFAAFLAGMVFCYALWRTGSLWWGIGFHLTWDWSESFLYGVPDSGILSAHRLFATHAAGNPLLSGGAAGPEGSVLVVPVLLLVLGVLRAWPGTPRPYAPSLLGTGASAPAGTVSAQPIA